MRPERQGRWTLAAVAAALASALLATAVPAKADPPGAPAWQRGKTLVVKSNYLELEVVEYAIPDGPAARGGALASAGAELIVASADGRFFGLNPASGTVRRQALPALSLGREQIARSPSITRVELPPRVHDVLVHASGTYVCFDRYDVREDRVHFHVARLHRSGRHWVDLYRSPPLDGSQYTMGNGGRLAMEPGGKRLFVTVGDYSLDRLRQRPSDIAAQKPGLPWGKVLALKLADRTHEVFSSGHRNAQGLLFLADGRLIASEHGPRGGDELNLIRQGLNYGWPHRSHGMEYASFDEYQKLLGPMPPGPFEEAMYVFVPSIAPTQLVQVRGFHPKWDGDLLLGSLQAMTLFHIRLAGERVLFVEPIVLGHRIRDIEQVGDGFVLLTDAGTLLTLKRPPSTAIAAPAASTPK